jgi:hypothetical protein
MLPLRFGQSPGGMLADAPHQTGDRQTGEGSDPVLQVLERLDEGPLPLDVGALNGSRVLDTPMRCRGVSRPYRAGFTSRAVTDGEDEVHDRGTGPGELLPTLGAVAFDRVPIGFEHLQGEGVHCALGLAPCRIGVEAPGSVFAENSLRKDRARCIARCRGRERYRSARS